MSRPIILDNAIMREEDNNKIFKYDYLNDMNYVYIDNKKILYLNFDIYLKKLKENNKISNKYDRYFSLLELESKTEVVRERDDEDCSLLELVSKTYVERERDDEDSIDFN